MKLKRSSYNLLLDYVWSLFTIIFYSDDGKKLIVDFSRYEDTEQKRCEKLKNNERIEVLKELINISCYRGAGTIEYLTVNRSSFVFQLFLCRVEVFFFIRLRQNYEFFKRIRFRLRWFTSCEEFLFKFLMKRTRSLGCCLQTFVIKFFYNVILLVDYVLRFFIWFFYRENIF